MSDSDSWTNALVHIIPLNCLNFFHESQGRNDMEREKFTMPKIFHIDRNSVRLSAAGLVSAQLSANDTRRATLAPQGHVYLQHICVIFQVRTF